MSSMQADDSGAVVVPAIASGSSVTSIRSLGRHGVRTIAAVEGPGNPVAQSRYCDETYVVPSPGEDLSRYTDSLLNIAQRDDVVTIVPLREPDIYVLSKHRAAFAEHIATPWPDYETIQLVQDKYQLVDEASGIGVPVPETDLLCDREDWDDTTVVKSRYSILEQADGTTFYPGVEFVSGGAPDTDQLVREMRHEPIAQEYVPGDRECGFFALFDHGEAVAIFAHERIRSYNYAGGASVYRKAVSVPELQYHGIRLLEHLDWHGPAMVEFKRDERDGSYRLMEINPRFWGSLALAVAAGVDFPSLYYEVATGGVTDPFPTYETGTSCHLFRGEMSYLYSLLVDDYDHVERPALGSELATVLASFVRQPNFDYLSRDDPKPPLKDVLNAATGLFR
ncbi:ATP-grasp domain-containing protein [Haloarchaeobius sp. DFWS5]|uniref:carboxylate--amine ligase n=1 Tax=Haloarchaeobius sp. DFWS5 TaxID=3446114 RepID=UPI003EBE7E5C